MKITTKLELHQLAIKLIDSIAYEKPISEIKAIVDDLSAKIKTNSASQENKTLDLEKEIINQ